jgi:phage tail tape-measure protein
MAKRVEPYVNDDAPLAETTQEEDHDPSLKATAVGAAAGSLVGGAAGIIAGPAGAIGGAALGAVVGGLIGAEMGNGNSQPKADA